jgi:hypothetical protein
VGRGGISNRRQLYFFLWKRECPSPIRDRMSYITLGGCQSDIIVLNVHASTEDKDDDIKDRFYEELEQVFDQFPRYHMKILMGNFNAKVGREDIFKPIIGNENLHEARNDNRVRVASFATSKNLIVKSTTFINTLELLLMVSHIIR